MKKKFRGIKIIVIFAIMFMVFQNPVFAALSGSAPVALAGPIQSFITKVGEFGMSASLASTATLVTGLAILLLLLMGLVWNLGAGATGTLYPFPDLVVFNRINILDPNFMNPASGSILGMIKGTILQFFNSFQTLGISILVIAAMVMGIKFAMSVIASEKAKYKEGLGKWLTGIVILIMLRYLIGGIFYINEQFVKSVANSAAEVAIPINLLESVPFFGNLINKIVSATGADTLMTVTMKGYLGIVVKNITQGIGGNIIGGIVSLIIIGQSIAVLIMYIKRVFYSMILGIVAPAIVATDTFSKSLGMKSQIFSAWLNEFVITVMMQSVHAIFLLVMMKMIKSIYETTPPMPDAIKGIVVIMLTSGLVKFEKMFKKMFGVKDGMLGDLKGGTIKVIGAAHGVSTAVKEVGNNAKKMSEATSKTKALKTERQQILRRLAADGNQGAANIINRNGSNRGENAGLLAGQNSANLHQPEGPQQLRPGQEAFAHIPSQPEGTQLGKDGKSYIDYVKSMVEQNKDAILSVSPDGAIHPGGVSDEGTILEETTEQKQARMAKEADQRIDGSDDRVVQAIEKLTEEVKRINAGGGAVGGGRRVVAGGATGFITDEDEEESQEYLQSGSQRSGKKRSPDRVYADEQRLAEIYKELAEQETKYSSSKLATLMSGASMIGGLGIGLGATDEFSEALQMGGYLTAGMDKSFEKIGSYGARKTRKNYYDQSNKEGQELGIEAMNNNKGILQPKSNFTINPLKHLQADFVGAMEVKHMIKGTMSQKVGKELEGKLKEISEEVRGEKLSKRIVGDIKQSTVGFKDVISGGRYVKRKAHYDEFHNIDDVQ